MTGVRKSLPRLEAPVVGERGELAVVGGAYHPSRASSVHRRLQRTRWMSGKMGLFGWVG